MTNIVTRLLWAGAALEARDQFRGTPLHDAANGGKPVTVAFLLAAGAGSTRSEDADENEEEIKCSSAGVRVSLRP